MFCPVCGHENLPGVDYCDNCGSSLYHFEPADDLNSKPLMEKAITREKLYQIYSKPAILVSPDTTIREIIPKMVEVGSYGALVIEEGEIVGIFTERSFIKRVCAQMPPDIDRPVKEVMSERIIKLKGTDLTVHAIHSLGVAGNSYAIVADDPPRVLSISDILQYIIELYPSLGGFDKLVDELKTIALEDGVITEEEQAILDKVEAEKESFLRIFARLGKAGFLDHHDKQYLEKITERFVPSVEQVADQDNNISKDEAALLRKIVTYFEANKDRFMS